MPPTKHKTGDIFQSHVHDAMFNLVGIATGQSIELLGMFRKRSTTRSSWIGTFPEGGRIHFRHGASPRRRDRLEVGGIVETRAKKVSAKRTTFWRKSSARHLEGDRPRSFRRREGLATAARGTEESSRRPPTITNPFLDALEKGRS